MPDGGGVVRRAAGAEGPQAWRPTACVPERPEPPSGVPLHAAARLVVEPGGVVLQRTEPAIVAARQLCLGGGIYRASASLAGGVQRTQGAPLPLYVYPRAAPASDAVQPNTPAATAWPCLVRSSTESV